MREAPIIDEPLNATERYLHACAVRLDALCVMLSSLVEAYAKQNQLATTTNEVVEKVVKEVSEEVAEVKEEVKPVRKRTQRK